jgi:predicted porin
MLNSNTLAPTSGKSGRRSAALSAAIAAALAMFASSTALADAELDALKKQVQDLQQKIDAMAKQQAAQPAAAPAAKEAAPPVKVSAERPDGALSMYGVTLYGTIDVNLLYQTHGTPLSDYFPMGTFSYIQKNMNHEIFTLGENGLSVSRLGLQGEKELMNGWSGVFRLESAIMPLAGNLIDALKSLTINNGIPCTSTTNCNQKTGVDSSFAGELFNSAAFVGFGHKQFGTFTFGRQNGLLADGIAKYDPMQTAQAFSVIGISGTAAGGGDTENRRLDNSLKYNLQYEALHAGAMYQFNGAKGQPGSAYQVVLGATFGQGSVDAFYTKKYDAIAASSLSAAQVATLGCPYTYTAVGPSVLCGGTAGTVLHGGGGNPIDKSVMGTISDNTEYSLMGQYTWDKLKVSGGYEHINFANPSDPLPAGTYTIGGYVLAYVNTQAGAGSTYLDNKVLQIWWLGGKYAISPALDWTVAWYHLDQNAFAVGANAGCSDARASNCKGTTDAFSTVLVYKLSKRFDTYGGAMWSEAKDGMANGFLYRTTINPTVGIRLTF